MRPSILDELKTRPLVCDGAMGTRLQEAVGAEREAPLELLNFERPEIVLGLHRSYVEAGADILQTNTYGANGLQFGRAGRANAVAAVNRRAVELARAAAESAGRPVWVAGSLGPLGTIRYDYDVIRPEQIGRIYLEQARALVEAGVDLLLIETMDDYREMVAALKALRQFELPLAISFECRDGETVGGTIDLAAAVQRAEALGADIVGVNCRIGPEQMTEVARRLVRLTELPVLAQPNGGNFAVDVYGRLHVMGTQTAFARMAHDVLAAGVSIVGGCCYTGPEHIAALRRAVDQFEPPQAGREARQFFLHRPQPSEFALRRVPSKLETKLAEGRFIVCVEVDPPTDEECRRDPGVLQLKIDGARYLDRRCAVDVITVADHTLGRPWLDAFPFAEALRPHLREADILLHYSCRNKAETDITGNFASFRLYGYKNILIITGDRPPEPDVKSFFAYSSPTLMRRVREEHGDWFFLAASFDHTRGLERGGTIGIEAEVRRLQRKIDAGARLALTQPIFADRLELLYEQTKDLGVPILPGIMPIMSASHARNLNENFGGMHIPESVIAELEAAGEDRRLRARIATETAARTARLAVRLGFPGIYLMTSFNRYDIIKEIIAQVRD